MTISDVPPYPNTRGEGALSRLRATRRLRWLQFPRSMRTSVRFGTIAAFGLWLGDLALLAVSHGQAKTWQWLTGAGAALFVLLSTALVVCSVLGPILMWMAKHTTSNRASWRAIFQNDGRRAHRILTAELTVVVMLWIWSWLAHRAIVGIELAVERPDASAEALTVFSWVFLASVALAWPWCHGAAAAMIDRALSSPGLGRLLSRIWPLTALVAIVAGFAAARLLAGYKLDMSVVPWHYAISLGGLIISIVFAAYLPLVTRPWVIWLRRFVYALAATAIVAATGAALRLRPEWSVVRTLAFDRALSGRIGYAAWTAAFDFDRDGQLGILGGGDCAPLDPHRYTGAVETLDNGVDEDCDGADLTRQSLDPRPRMAVGQDLLPRRPTIVLVTIDALSAQKLTMLGSPTSIMPHLDEFAGRSMLFTHCFAQGPSTRLSFPSIFTSRWDSQLAWQAGPANPHSFAPSERQLQDVLDDAGYETVAVIPQDYFDRDRWPAITRGFQRVDRYAIPFGKHNAPQVTDAALRVLSEQRNRPLYLWMHYYDAHAPYLRLPGVQYTGEDNELLALHNAELHYIDGELGRLIATVDGRSGPTYLIVTADHATVFHPNPSSRRGHYGFDLYSATLHVPLVVHGPGIRAGRADAIVSTMDIAPTIADMIGVDSANSEGTSLMPELLAQRTDTQRVIFHELYLPERLFHGYEPLEIVSLRTGEWNLILNRVRGIYELYDFPRDYFEQIDLYEQQARSPEVMHLKSLLGAFIQRFASTYGAPVAARRSTDPIFRILRPQ